MHKLLQKVSIQSLLVITTLNAFVTPLFANETTVYEAGNAPADIYVSPFGEDKLSTKQQASNEVLYISNKGDDSNLGSKKMPFKTISKAVERAQKLQEGDTNKIITIELAPGVYDGATIEKGIVLRGSGSKTVIKGRIELESLSSVVNLRSDEIVAKYVQNITVSGVDVRNLSVLSIGDRKNYIEKVKISESLRLFGELDSLIELKEVKINGGKISVGNSGYAINAIFDGLYIDKFQKENEFAMYISDSASVAIKNLFISNSKSGIRNGGNLTINNAALKNISNVGICNASNATVQITNVKFESNSPRLRQTDNCDIQFNSPVDISGQIDRVQIAQ